ncbi:TAF3 Transcription initiation factor TFIID subunit 3 [Candida maltosa Xu316]|uniref:Bromodomain associated domain-containing protein n=1 Tax=Candida maltosa (strain Xu316) TaxID=1245528 RepID=M3IQB9_CANMX|nr:hypothetical protein G210_0743 [Candida maltosa Xu316]
MDESFYFSLLRISVAQIFKANGFDKCKPSTLNVVTDLYLQIFEKAIIESLKCSNVRTNSNSPELQDITQALINIGVFKVNDITRIHDQFFEESKYNTKSIESFKQWCAKSGPFAIQKKLNEVPNPLIKNLIEKRKLDIDDGESDLAKRKRKHKERQEFYNQLKLNDEQQRKVDEDELNEDIITEKDKLSWFNYLIEKDLKLGHDLKFLNADPIIVEEFLKYQNNYKFHPVDTTKDSVKNWDRIQNHLKHLNKTDHIVSDAHIDEVEGIENEEDFSKSLKQLNTILPYNLKYHEDLLEDDLSKFVTDKEEEEAENLETGDENEPIQENNSNLEHDGIVNDMILPEDNNLIAQDEEIGEEHNLMLM